jgi:hypothetical protein
LYTIGREFRGSMPFLFIRLKSYVKLNHNG